MHRRPALITEHAVMQYHDDELEALPACQVERQLAWDAHQRGYLESLEVIADGVRDAARQATPAFDLTDQIMARIAVERSTSPSAANWRRKITVALGVGLGSTAALAAGALFWLSVRMPSENQAEVTFAARTLERPPVSDGASAGVAIESVDFGVGGGSIFMVQAGATPTPVVWLTEPPEVEVGSEPL